MENKKLWLVLIYQMVIELVFLTLFYLYVGNNFGNNFSADVLTKGEHFLYGGGSSSGITSSCACADGFIAVVFNLLYLPLAIVGVILVIIVAFSCFWIPPVITFLICRDRIRKLSVKVFWGESSDDAVPIIQEWCKNKQKIYIPFVIVSRILCFVLLIFKAIHAPSDYVVYFASREGLKWEMTGKLMGQLIAIVGAILLFVSAITRISFFKNTKTYYFEEYVCPHCNCFSKRKLVKKTKIQEAEYEYWETNSGYYSPEKTGELRDSAGNTIGDVYEDTWHDTSKTHSRMISPAIWDYTYEWRPCHCTEHKKVEKKD